MNEELKTIDGHAVLHVERSLSHPVDKVWRCLTEPELLKTWFPSQVDVDLRVGGAIRFFGDPHLPEGSAGTITELDPPRVIAFDWAGDLLRWQLIPRNGGTLLVLDQTVADRPGAASYAAGWNICLTRMDVHLSGRPESAADDEPYPVAHEKFVKLLGLDKGEILPGTNGWTIRLERNLTMSVEQAADQLPGTALADADLRPGTGGARLVAERSGVTERLAAEDLLESWQEAVRGIAVAQTVGQRA